MHKSHQASDYTSNLYVGKEARDFLTSIWPDFKTEGIDVALDERVSGYVGTRNVLRGLVEKCEQNGVEIRTGVEVTGYDTRAGSVKAVTTSQGDIDCDAVIWALGAWTPQHWAMLGKPPTSTAPTPTAPWSTRTCGPSGDSARARSTSTSPTLPPRQEPAHPPH